MIKRNLGTLIVTLFWIIVLCFVLIKCKKDEPIVQSNTIAVEQVTKIIDYKFLPIIEGKLNGKIAYFLLDTGASISVIDKNQFEKYGVIEVGKSDTGVVGYGGTDSELNILENVNVYVGNTNLTGEFHGKNIKTIVQTINKSSGYKVVGILGNNNISTNRWILDFKNGNILK